MTILLIIAAAVLVAVLFAVVLYCALVDGARRRRYQDRVAEEWLARKAAPTVSCAECEYGPPPADAVGARTACLHCYCGDNFERRQP